MTIAVVSDLHLGDPACSLITGELGARRTTPDYQRLVAVLHHHDAVHEETGIDYLVLLGDALDLAVASYETAYDVARVFFRALAGEKGERNAPLIKQLIYVPGNHDYAVWSTVMHQANVVNRLENERRVVDRWSSPGVIDFRASAGADRGRLVLPKVTKQEGRDDYGGLYLDALTRNPGRFERPLIFNVAYPNLYIVDDQRTVVLTHGHYLETPWAISADLVMQIAYDDLTLLHGDRPSIDDIVALNLPFAELTSASLGMAGPLVKVVQRVQREYKDKDRTAVDAERAPKIRKYFGRVRDILDEQVLTAHGLREPISDLALDVAKDWAVKKLLDAKAAVHDEAFPEARWVRGYCEAIDRERAMLELDTPEVTNLICAHSHRYVPWDGEGVKAVDVPGHSRPVAISNTGGWLRAQDHDLMDGGVFFYDNGIWRSTVLR